MCKIDFLFGHTDMLGTGSHTGVTVQSLERQRQTLKCISFYTYHSSFHRNETQSYDQFLTRLP